MCTTFRRWLAYLINHEFLSLRVCGEIAEYHGLQINISNINPEIANRIETPALIKWEDNFAVVSGINREGLEIIIPSEGYKNINFENLKNFFPDGIEILNLEKTN